MKAIVIREHGGVERLEKSEVPDPTPRAGEAVVAVRAVALNHLDIWLRRGVPGHKFPLPMIPGAEVSGVIDEVPDGYGWKRGDEVIIAPGLSCSLCIACLSGNDPLCPDFGILGEARNHGNQVAPDVNFDKFASGDGRGELAKVNVTGGRIVGPTAQGDECAKDAERESVVNELFHNDSGR